MPRSSSLSILIITYYWPPAGGPGVQRWLKLSKYLADKGARVRVVTVDPEKATWPVQDEALLAEVHKEVEVHNSNTFELFGAYLKATGRKEVPYSGFANEVTKPGFRQRAAKFVRGNFFLPDARKGWNKHAYKKAESLCREENPDLIITTGPPHSTHLVGKKLKRNFSTQWIADFRDPWTDIYYYDSLYPTQLARWYDKRMEASVIREADHVLGSSPYLTELLKGKTEKEKGFHFFPNGYDPLDFPSEVPKINSRHIVYTGTITSIYPIHSLIQALNNLKGESDWTFDLFGKCDQELDNALTNADFDYVSHGFISHKEATYQMMAADVLLLVIPKQNPNKGIIPGKIFEYIGSGRPVLGIGPIDSDAANLIRTTGSGEFFDYEDVTGIQSFLKKPFANKEGASTPPFTFSRPVQADQLLQIIQSKQ